MPTTLTEIQGSKLRLKLHPGQRQAWQSDALMTWIIAGTQSGKTSFGGWWLWREIERRGAGDYLAVTATYDLFKLKMLPELKNIFCRLVGGWKYLGGDRVLYRPKDKSRIILRSANAPEGLESATAKGAWLDECGQDGFRIESFEAVQRRLSLNEGRILGTTTPYNLGWLKTEAYNKWVKGDPTHRVIQFASTMNPQFPRAEYERVKASGMPSWKFNMFYNGIFERPAGMIYKDYNEKIHLIEPVPLKPEWPRYVGVDFGAVNTATVWICEDPDKNILYLYRDTLEGDKTTGEHAEGYKDQAQAENVVAWVGGAPSEKQNRWDFGSFGVPITRPPISDVESGINRVIELFKKKRLFIFNTCRGVLDEIGTYSREVDTIGQPTDKIKDKEKFHRLDSLRYVTSFISQPGVVTEENVFYS